MDKTIFQSAEAIIKRISIAIDEKGEDIIKFIRALIQTPSLPGEEKAVQEIVALKLNQLNLDVKIIPRPYNKNCRSKKKMEAAGVEVIEYEGRELSLKGTGGPTFLTCPVKRL